jgi:capsular polysaccharide transport system ATP-binding protein
MANHRLDATVALGAMIVLDSVTRSLGRSRARRAVLDGIDAMFETGGNYVILGQRSAGKTTLLRVLSGLQKPTSGRVRRYGSVSLPAGSAASLAGTKTGRQLAGFLATLYDSDPGQITRFTASFSGLNDVMDMPVAALSASDRVRLGYALTYAIPCDFYLFDDGIIYGDVDFRRACARAFENRRRSGGTIVATRNVRTASSLGERGGILHAGKLYLFDTVAAAVEIYQQLELSEKVAGLGYAEALLRNGDLDKAREHLKQHLTDGDGAAESYELLANLSLKSGHYVDAIEASAAALDRAPGSVASYLVLAKVAEQQGQFAAVVENAEKLLDLVPSHREARVMLAKAYDNLGMNEAAAATWRNLAAVDGDTVSLRLAIRNDIKAENWDGVLTTVAVALTRQPNDAGLLEMRARSLLELRRWAEAQHAVSELAEIDVERAFRTVHRLTKTVDWQAIPGFLSTMTIDLAPHRGSRTMVLILTFLERQAALAERSGRASEAVELLRVVASIDPTRARAVRELDRKEAPPAETPRGSDVPDLTTAEGVVRELSNLRTNRGGMNSAEFADRVKAAWAAAKAYLPGEGNDTP